MTPPQRLAVIGSGITGLTAAYIASQNPNTTVTVFEADNRLGGHANTHQVTDTNGQKLNIDTGFIVHNRRTYPTLLRLFEELDVATQPSEMSMSIWDQQTQLNWAGALGHKGIIPTRKHLTDTAYLRMLADIPRFHKAARALLKQPDNTQTVKQFLAQHKFGPYFQRHFAEPLIAAVWSCDPNKALLYPAAYLFSFLANHGMLSIFGSPQWRTVTGGSIQYVQRIATAIQNAGGHIKTNTPIKSIRETHKGVVILDKDGHQYTFDAAIIACHPHQALSMLAEPTPEHTTTLHAIQYTPNTAILHTDETLLPPTKNTHASWNFLRPNDNTNAGVTVTYDLTRLQRLDTKTHYLVTLGSEHLINPDKIIARINYEHPLYTPQSVAAQTKSQELNTQRVVFCGAWKGWGFHEDGALAGKQATEHLGYTWPTPDTDPKPHLANTSNKQWAQPHPGVYTTRIRHTRHTPIKRSFVHTSAMWVADIDNLPNHGRLKWLKGDIEARDHLGDSNKTIRQNLQKYLETHNIHLDAAGQVFMATQPRALGYCFNPISVYWCLNQNRQLQATVIEVHNTYGDRHAYLAHLDKQGRATIDKQMYVSPFNNTQGTYTILAPVPNKTLNISVHLKSKNTAFTATLTGQATHNHTLRAATASIKAAVLIRTHGIWLWARGMKIQPRPTHVQQHVQPN